MNLVDRMVWPRTIKGLRTTEKLTLYVLISYANKEGFCHPSVALLAEGVGVSQRRVRAAIEGLCKRGIVTRKQQGFNRANSYHIALCDRTLPSAHDRTDSSTLDRTLPSAPDENGMSDRTDSSAWTGRQRPPEVYNEVSKEEYIQNTLLPHPMKPDADTGSEAQKPPKRATPKPTPDPLGNDLPDFVRFWEAYPKRKDRPGAVKAWRKLNPSSDLVETILADVGAKADSFEWMKESRQYCPYPATYLNRRRWEDDPDLFTTSTRDERPESYVDRLKEII